MSSWESEACQRKTLSSCTITSLVLLVGLLMFLAIYLTLSWKDIIGESYVEGPMYDSYDNCTSKATVVNDEALTQRWDSSSNFSPAWRDAEQKAIEPAHTYMKKHHSVAIYFVTHMLKSTNQDGATAETTGKQLTETFESRSLFVSLSEAIQILKHSQVTCISTNYRTETLLNLISSKTHIRFSTFILGSDEWNFTKNASCFEVYTCFGADVTYYSASKQNKQVLIPPYEVFKVTHIQTDTQRCKIIYKLKSNLNCVYDRESNMLHSISALTVEGFWVIFTIICIIIVSLLLPFVIVKVLDYHRKIEIYRASSLHNSTYTPGVF
ncbi:ecto-ADP-ribosyltransferase 4-like [Mastacembelus armatus]|uniref:NAD(P)(+)--arginine ADP-ribosyltransferase n=1 Tax=Mastacembelus armatus TaxID=205130 RepID=A0A3Q3SG02_9TELE|nr:ecto-ADP-ribosyltransferase 4-like [Mastacembelus armatus]